MAKKKSASASEGEGEGILDILGIADPDTETTKKAADPGTAEGDRIKALLGTIEGLTNRVDQMQGDFMRLASGGAAQITVPDAPKMAEVSFDGLPDQADDPEGFAKGLNSRMNDTLAANMKALSDHQAANVSAQSASSARSDQLWSDFQSGYFDKLEADLPDTVSDVTPYVETAAKAVAAKAVRGISDPAQKARVLDNLMYGQPTRFMEDVFTEADRVLSPLRVKPEGEGEGDEKKGPTPEEMADANRTGGIAGTRQVSVGKKSEEEIKAGTMVGDIQDIQRATGFF